MDKPLIDILWVTVSSGLVLSMQAGLLCLETGLTRSKNNINVAIKNLTDLGVSIVIFWALGYGMIFGMSSGGLIGSTNFIPDLSYSGVWFAVFLLYEAMFCGTAVTISSGAIAERMRFSGYILVGTLISSLVYPVFGHWAWNGSNLDAMSGWLGRMGFVDFGRHQRRPQRWRLGLFSHRADPGATHRPLYQRRAAQDHSRRQRAHRQPGRHSAVAGLVWL